MTSLGRSAIISSLLVLPFVVLELVNRGSFPLPLFVAMWLLGFSFMFIATPLARVVRDRNIQIVRPLSLVSRAICLILIVFFWVGLVLDQMPCFLGVPNCD